MAEFPTYEEMDKNVAEKALDEVLYDGRSIREWMWIIAQEDCISRQAVLKYIEESEADLWHNSENDLVCQDIKDFPSVTSEQKIGHCRDCKWWKDSDGFYRRGGHAESQCPINRREVFEGNGYCYIFEPKMQGVQK